MRTGVFGGAFNPVHSGHINLAKYYLNELNLDRIIFIPTANPPHRSGKDFADKEDRFNMLSLAIKGIDGFEISDIEYRRNEKSYTYDTLCELKNLYPDDEFFLLIGADQFLNFQYWYRYKDILDMATLCTAARLEENEKEKIENYSKTLLENKREYYLSTFPVLRVSSSEIREKVKSGKSISSLVPKEVEEYIIAKGIYNGI